MTEDERMRLIYLGALLLLIVAGMFVINRERTRQMLRHAAGWFFIFLCVTVGYGFWTDFAPRGMPRQTVMAEGDETWIEVRRSPDGHYRLMLDVNGAPIHFVVDTGATDLVLSQEDAQIAGLDPEGLRYVGRALTANGEVRTARVQLDEVTLGGIVDRRVPAVVNGGEMFQSLLGMAYLDQFGRIEIEDGVLRLRR